MKFTLISISLNNFIAMFYSVFLSLVIHNFTFPDESFLKVFKIINNNFIKITLIFARLNNLYSITLSVLY